MFKYPPEIRTLIYTTNAIKNFSRQLRKVTKTKSAFVSDDALMKILYLATMAITGKWAVPIQDWPTILAIEDKVIFLYSQGFPRVILKRR